MNSEKNSPTPCSSAGPSFVAGPTAEAVLSTPAACVGPQLSDLLTWPSRHVQVRAPAQTDSPRRLKESS